MPATSELANRWRGRTGRVYTLVQDDVRRDGGMASIRRVRADGPPTGASTAPEGEILAIKLARSEDVLAREALAREVDTFVALSRSPGSPPCPRLYDVVGQPAEALVMEWCPTDMERWWESHWSAPRSFVDLCEAMADVCRRVREYAAVAELTLGKRVIHADIKPRNVLRSTDGRWLLTDFGAAKARPVEEETWAATRMILGTENFIAPEALFNARKPFPAAMDTWSIACSFFALLRVRAHLRGGGRMPSNGTHAHHFRTHRVALVGDLQQRKPTIFADRALDPAAFQSPDRIPDKDRAAVAQALEGVFGDPNPTLEATLLADTTLLLDRALRIDPAERFTDPLELAAEFEALAQRFRELVLRATASPARVTVEEDTSDPPTRPTRSTGPVVDAAAAPPGPPEASPPPAAARPAPLPDLPATGPPRGAPVAPAAAHATEPVPAAVAPASAPSSAPVDPVAPTPAVPPPAAAAPAVPPPAAASLAPTSPTPTSPTPSSPTPSSPAPSSPTPSSPTAASPIAASPAPPSASSPAASSSASASSSAGRSGPASDAPPPAAASGFAGAPPAAAPTPPLAVGAARPATPGEPEARGRAATVRVPAWIGLAVLAVLALQLVQIGMIAVLLSGPGAPAAPDVAVSSPTPAAPQPAPPPVREPGPATPPPPETAAANAADAPEAVTTAPDAAPVVAPAAALPEAAVYDPSRATPPRVDPRTPTRRTEPTSPVTDSASGLVMVSGAEAYLVGPTGRRPVGSVPVGAYELYARPKPDGDFVSLGTIQVGSDARVVWKCGLGTCRPAQ